MPTDACLFFHDFPDCGAPLKARARDCCASFGDVPPMRAQKRCCG